MKHHFDRMDFKSGEQSRHLNQESPEERIPWKE